MLLLVVCILYTSFFFLSDEVKADHEYLDTEVDENEFRLRRGDITASYEELVNSRRQPPFDLCWGRRDNSKCDYQSDCEHYEENKNWWLRGERALCEYCLARGNCRGKCNKNKCFLSGEYIDEFCSWLGPKRGVVNVEEKDPFTGVFKPLETYIGEPNVMSCLKQCKKNQQCKTFIYDEWYQPPPNTLPGGGNCSLFKSGEIGTQERVDYYISEKAKFAGMCEHPRPKCSPEQTCKAGEGDCDNDDDCEKGLICGRNNCKKTKGKWWEDNYPDMKDTADCCTKDIDWDHCTPNTPCGEERGDCDRDKDCKKGLSCKKCRYGNRRAQCCRK